MSQSQLPPAFTAYLKECFSSGKFPNVKKFFRGMVLRWTLWSDGHTANAFPGYATCPPADPKTGVPSGWSYQVFNRVATRSSRAADTRPQIDMAKVIVAASKTSTFRPVAKPLHHSRPPEDAARRKPLTNLTRGCSGFGRRQFLQD